MRMISAWAAHAPATQIAAIYEISDSTVRLYDKEVLKTDLPPPNLDHLRTLLVDEKAVRRGHNYVTIVLNGDTGELLYMAEGKKREVLDRFFEQLNPEPSARSSGLGGRRRPCSLRH
jgi:transposase